MEGNMPQTGKACFYRKRHNDHTNRRKTRMTKHKEVKESSDNTTDETI